MDESGAYTSGSKKEKKVKKKEIEDEEREANRTFLFFREVFSYSSVWAGVILFIVAVLAAITLFFLLGNTGVGYVQYSWVLQEWAGSGTGYLLSLNSQCAPVMAIIAAAYGVFAMLLLPVFVSIRDNNEERWFWETYLWTFGLVYIHAHLCFMLVGFTDLFASILFPGFFALPIAFILLQDTARETSFYFKKERSSTVNAISYDHQDKLAIGVFLSCLGIALISVIILWGKVIIQRVREGTVPWLSWVIVVLIFLEYVVLFLLHGITVALGLYKRNAKLLVVLMYAKPWIYAAMYLGASLLLALLAWIAGLLGSDQSYGYTCNT